MASGFKTGGRQAGTPNKRTKIIDEKLAELSCDPIKEMARLAQDAATPLSLRAMLFRELAQYVAPKCRAVEINDGEENIPLSVTVRFIGPDGKERKDLGKI